MTRVLVLGGGFGGVVSAGVLKKVAGEAVDVTVIDKNIYHQFRPSFPLFLLGKRNVGDVTRKLSRLHRKNVSFIHGFAKELDLPRRRLLTTAGELEYDFLVVSPGVEFHKETVPGFEQYAFNIYQLHDLLRASRALADFEQGRIVIFISSLPIICATAPYEVAFLLDEYIRIRGKRNRVALTIVTPEPNLLYFSGPLVGRAIRDSLLERGIDVISEAKVLHLTKNHLVLDHGVRIPGDLFLGVAPHWSPAIIRNSELADRTGWADVDPGTLESKTPGVFVIGDAAGLKLPTISASAPKAGIFAHYQGEVVARNIARRIMGQEPNFRYTGKGACILSVSSKRARYGSVRLYHKPSPLIVLFRPTMAANWGKILFEKYWLNCWI